MKRNILPLVASLLLLASTLFSVPLKAQLKLSDYDPRERVIVMWNSALENTRLKYKVSEKDFNVFRSFDLTPIQMVFMEIIKETKGLTDPVLIASKVNDGEKALGTLYEKFLLTKKEYPSSVAEYEHPRRLGGPNPCDSSGCTNMGFEDGTFNTWYGYWGDNESVSNHNVLTVTGGYIGAATEAADDPTSMAYMNANYAVGWTHDYQLSITNSGFDHIIPSIPRVTPFGGLHSAMVGDSYEQLDVAGPN